MAKTIKLPADLRDWKVTSFVGEDNGCEVYKVSRKIDKNTAQNAILRHAFIGKNNYNDERAEYFAEEADFIESVKNLDGVSNYLDVYVQDNQNKETCDLYIFTEELTSLDELMKAKTFTENEVIDFGIQMSSLLETLETKNIFHGNISPKNIFVTAKKLRFYNGKKLAFTVPKGKQVTLKKLTLSKGNIYLQFQYGKKTGWISVNNKNYDFESPYFKKVNSRLAG